MVVQMYYIKGLVLCQIVVLISVKKSKERLCVRESMLVLICIRLSQAARRGRDMYVTIAMGSIQAALLLKSSMNIMVGTRPRYAHIMPVWIAWTIPNAIGVAGILWWQRRGYGNGWKFMV